MNQTFLRSAGETYKDFKAINCTRIEELDCFFRELVHVPTGAHVIHLENKDPENLFCLSFRTLPQNSNGVAHILEHTVLCGSKKFPVKDPFFAMTRRSLNTFMNALTGSDFTCYPASSQVEKDFYNLLEVYLDAVFHAQLKKNSFLQEGCRLEFEDALDPLSPLKFKGIVYNEMKGSLASGDSRMWHAVIEGLCPDLPYGHNSGGDPKEIPKLSYQELFDFYKTYYHPSRCLFFFCGNLSLKNHLDYIAENALKDITPLPPIESIPKQPRFKTPIIKTIPYAVSLEEDSSAKIMVAFGWLTCPLIEQEEVLALSVLDCILTDTDASPLKAALIESGLCTQADAFMDTEMSEVPYVIACKGCKEENIDKLEEVLFKKLDTLSKEPLLQHWIDAAIHQLELARMEISGDHSPFGLTLFFRSALAKQHGCDPEKALQLLSLFETLIEQVKDPLYLPGLIKKHLVDNQHRIKVIMLPDPNLGEKESEEERILLETIKSKLSPAEIENLIKTADELEKIQHQAEDQDLTCLPKVTLDDVPVLTKDFLLEKKTKDPLEVFHHECFTNHLLYADVCFDLPNIQDDEISYLQLLLYLIPELGSKGRNYKENLEYMQTHTGGLSITASLNAQVQDRSILKPAISMRGRSLARKAERLLPFMQDMLTTPDLKDKKRVADRIKHLHTSLQNRVSKNSLGYATQLAFSGNSTSSHFQEACFGLRYYHFILNIAENLEAKIGEVTDKLIELHQKLFSFHNPHLIVSCDSALYEKMMSTNIWNFSLPRKTFSPWNPSFSLATASSQGRIITDQVAYNVKSYRNVASYIHPHAPALTIATQLLDNKILHNKIREIGGAYGSGANYSSGSGLFYFYSYRDPHIARTFSTFDQAVDAIAAGKFNKQDLEEAKLGCIQHFDAPICPSGRAILAYSWQKEGRNAELRQEYRNRLLETDSHQIKMAIESELLSKKEQAINVSFASKEQLEKENILLAKKNKALPIFEI